MVPVNTVNDDKSFRTLKQFFLVEANLLHLALFCLVLLLCCSQDDGFQGRPNKLTDSCCSFWVGATLALLGALNMADKKKARAFHLSCQNAVIGEPLFGIYHALVTVLCPTVSAAETREA